MGQLLGRYLLDQRFDVRGGVEGHQIERLQVHLVQIRRDRAGEDHRIDLQLQLGQRLGQLGLVRLAQRQQETLLLMLDNELDEVGERPVGKGDLPLPVDDVFLQIERYGLRLTDVFHGLGHGDAGLLADVEEAVDRRARRENDCGMIQNFDSLAAELLQRYAHDPDQRVIFDLDRMFLRHFEERGFLGNGGSGLRYQNLTYFQL